MSFHGGLLGVVAGIVLFARFLLAAVLLTTHWVDTWFLAERQAAAVDPSPARNEGFEASIHRIKEQVLPRLLERAQLAARKAACSYCSSRQRPTPDREPSSRRSRSERADC